MSKPSPSPSPSTRCRRIVAVAVIVAATVIVSGSEAASLSLADENRYRHVIEGQGLYAAGDDVEVFTAANFRTKLYGRPRALLLEFYNSWCGFCQRFAPSWKALATDLRPWSPAVGIGAIDCSDDDNGPICRDFEVLGYPTLRYFHEKYPEGPGRIGANVQKGEDLEHLRHALLAQMLQEQIEGRGKVFPGLLASDDHRKNQLFDNVAEKVRFMFLIVLDQFLPLSSEVIMDLSKVPEVAVVPVLKNNTVLLDNLDVHQVPSVWVVHRNFTVQKLDAPMTREGIQQAIQEFLKPRGITIKDVELKSRFTGQWMQNPVPDIGALLEAHELQELKKKVKKMGNVVFQMDLETALRMSLKHEVAATKAIEGEQLTALKNYVDIIIKYFPLTKKGRMFFNDIKTEITRSEKLIKGADLAKLLEPMDDEKEQIFSTPQRWLGCAGSTQKFRGYPCGMWKMFHYLTVNAAEINSDKPDTDPREVLEAMLGYIKHFFGCADCSMHFQEMAIKNELHAVSELNSSIIWLWLAHNQVNKRLAGDTSEDPQFPKIQFPSVTDCPKCRDEDKWNFTQVLLYLKQMYSNVNIRYLGADTRLLHDGLTTTRAKRSTTSWVVINRMDVSMCFVLYVVCFGLMAVIVRLFLKKNYKKKMYVHDILGKV